MNTNRVCACAVEFVLCIALGCSDGQTHRDSAEWFEMRDGEAVVTLRIEPDSLTIFERKGDTDLQPPESMPGKRTDSCFRFPDGTELAISEGKLTWPESSLLPGAVFTECDPL